MPFYPNGSGNPANRDISSANGVEDLVGQPSPPLAEEELTPEMKRWRELFGQWDAQGETDRTFRFDRLFTQTYAPRCNDCYTRRAKEGHSRCEKCLAKRREKDRKKREAV